VWYTTVMNSKKHIAVFVILIAIVTGVILYGYSTIPLALRRAPINFAECNDNTYCIAQKFVQIRTFTDYDAYVQTNNSVLDFVAFTINTVAIHFLPIERDSITEEYCNTLQSPTAKETCAMAYKVRTDTVDCSMLGKTRYTTYFDDGESTQYIDQQALCIQEKVLANQITDCNAFEGELYSKCQLTALSMVNTIDECTTILEEITDAPEVLCSAVLELRKTQTVNVNDCKNATECYEFTSYLLPYLALRGSKELCTQLDAENREQCTTAIGNIEAFNTNNPHQCSTQECFDITISKMVYHNAISPQNTDACNKFTTQEEVSSCVQAVYTTYALFNRAPQYCADVYCLERLQQHITNPEVFCEELQYTAGTTDEQDELQGYCKNFMRPKIAAKNSDLRDCENSVCLREMYQELIRNQQYSTDICQKIENTYDQEVCVRTLNTAEAIATQNIQLCSNEAECIQKYVVATHTKQNDPCSALQQQDSKALCEDELLLLKNDDALTLADCTQFHTPTKCIEIAIHSFDEESTKAFDYSACSQFNDADGEYCMNTLSQAAGTYKGCSSLECIEVVYGQTDNNDCTDIGVWNKGADTKELQTLCKNYVSAQEAVVLKDVRNCTNEQCIERILSDVNDKTFVIAYIRRLELPKSLVLQMFIDPFEEPLDVDGMFDGTLVLTKQEIQDLPDYHSLPATDKENIDTLFSQLDIEKHFDDCDTIDKSLQDIFEVPLHIACKQIISTERALQLDNGNLCGTEECIESFLEEDSESIDCTKIPATYVDTFNDESLKDICIALKADR
jgi:hypothetical protein